MKTGQCLCGEIKYEVSGDLLWAGACHCRMCQRQSGGAFQIWASTSKKNFKLTSGIPKKFQSSANVFRSSCPTCSSHLFFEYKDAPGDLYITTVSFDDPEIIPEQHIWWSSKLKWLCLNDGIETREK